MSTLSVLIIDDNVERCKSLTLLLDFMEYHFQQVASFEDANALSNQQFDLIIAYASESLPLTLKQLNELFPSGKVAALSEVQDSDEHQDEEKRFNRYPNFLGMLNLPLKKQQFKQLISNLEEQPTSKKTAGKKVANSILDELFVGESVQITQVKKLITQVAKSNASVLILGESGTGKEVVANCLHKLSKRHSMPYVPVNCGAIPKDLLESELFGHEKGAFTGALTARKGRFELAQGGSLFLDEIGDMPLPMQVKILRVLQERMFERVGGNKSIQADVRVIAATHRELENEVKEGQFREDLFYRLNVFPIEIPALRERAEDLPLLFNVLNQRMQDESDNSVSLTPQAMASLMQHPWPGNVRELSNLVERLGIMFPDETVGWDELPEKYQYDISHLEEMPQLHPVIDTDEDLDGSVLQEERIFLDEENALDGEHEQAESIANGSASFYEQLPEDDFDLKEHMANLEYSLIQQALKESDGVVAHAAKRLNMRRTTLVEKMKKYESMFSDNPQTHRP